MPQNHNIINIYVFVILFITFLVPDSHAASSTPLTCDKICDMQAAVDYCDNHALQQPEGIWIYPEDNVVVLIARDESQSGNVTAPTFNIYVVETPDCNLKPGQTIGWLSRLADSSSFQMSLFTHKKGIQLIMPARCVATLTDNQCAMKIKQPSVKFSLNPSILLPKFWRLVRVRINDPMQNAPVGMIKIYPNENGTSPRAPQLLYF